MRLTGFSKTPVKANDSRKVTISVEENELSYFDEGYGKFLIEGGKYELFLSVRGVLDLIPAGSIYVEGSEELRCGPEWTFGHIAEYEDLVAALRKDCEEAGLDFMVFVSMVRYTPNKKLGEVCQDTSLLKNFLAAAGRFKPQ